jgi:hypothetical protein
MAAEHPEEAKSGRTRKHRERPQKGSPAQTGPGAATGMATDEGSGFAPKGERFGDQSTEGAKKGDEATRNSG